MISKTHNTEKRFLAFESKKNMLKVLADIIEKESKVAKFKNLETKNVPKTENVIKTLE